MAAGVLNTPRAVEISVYVVRAFVQLREVVATHKGLARKIEAMEKKYDKQFRVVFDAIEALMREEEMPKHKIGHKIERPR